MIESLGCALGALHRVPVAPGLLPPWLADALADKPRVSFHPPVVNAALHSVESARRQPGHDARLLSEVTAWIQQRQPLFADDEPVLVHGDVHGSNVVVDAGRVTGLVDFAESLAQPADVELDTILRWCAKAREYPPAPPSEASTRSLSLRSPDGCGAHIRNCSSASVCTSGCSSMTCSGSSRSTHTTLRLMYAQRRRTELLACCRAITIWIASSGSRDEDAAPLTGTAMYPPTDAASAALLMRPFAGAVLVGRWSARAA